MLWSHANYYLIGVRTTLHGNRAASASLWSSAHCANVFPFTTALSIGRSSVRHKHVLFRWWYESPAVAGHIQAMGVCVSGADR